MCDSNESEFKEFNEFNVLKNKYTVFGYSPRLFDDLNFYIMYKDNPPYKEYNT